MKKEQRNEAKADMGNGVKWEDFYEVEEIMGAVVKDPGKQEK